jgi:hypothetical protein
MIKENLGTEQLQDANDNGLLWTCPQMILTEYCASVYKSRKLKITMLCCVNATDSQNHSLR